MVALIRTLDIAFAFILQLLFLDYTANIYSIVGAALVLGCNMLVILNRAGFMQKNVTEKNDDFPSERKALIKFRKRQLYGKDVGKHH